MLRRNGPVIKPLSQSWGRKGVYGGKDLWKKGRSWAGSERERELWMVRVVSWESKRMRAVGLGNWRSAPAQWLWVYLFAFHVCWYRGISSDRKLSPGFSRWVRSTSCITRLARATSSINIQRFYAPRTCCCDRRIIQVRGMQHVDCTYGAE